MNQPLSRRQFFGLAAATGLTLAANRTIAAEDKVVVGVMGMGGRGRSLAKTFQQQPGVSVAYVCDPDAQRAGKAVEELAGNAAKPQPVTDYRKILDDKTVDVLVCAAPNHWHAPATILACAAGKHVYVEKPCSHNPREGELMVAAARKASKRVQMGNQRRSWTGITEAINELKNGVIGRVYLAQAWYTANRPTIGQGQEAPVPAGLDYELWQGPAPRKPFRSNYLHYNWHWFWHWGNGELGNNGIHMIDLCRWGLGVEFPTSVTSSGGRYRFTDDQETPDTHLVTFGFEGRRTITWQGLSCNQLPAGMKADVLFTGEQGTLAINGGSYEVFDLKGKSVKKGGGNAGDVGHIANFLAAVRGQGQLNSEIREGAISTLLCHLGNISHRVGRSLRCDPATGAILGDKEAMTYWSREYAPGYEPKV